MAQWIPLFQGWWSKINLQISIKLTPSVFSKSRPHCHHHLTVINFFALLLFNCHSWGETCCPLFQRFLEVLPFQGLCHIGFFPKVDQLCVQVSPFSKVCFYPNSFPNCSLPLRPFPKVCGCFPADTLFQRYLRAGSMRCEGLCQAMQSLWRSLSSSYINPAFLTCLLT